MTETANSSELSLPELKSHAQEGDADAQVELGLRYLKSGGISFQEIAYWFHLAASQGQPIAQWKMAVFHAIGRGVQQNAEKANDYYKKAISTLPESELKTSFPEDAKVLIDFFDKSEKKTTGSSLDKTESTEAGPEEASKTVLQNNAQDNAKDGSHSAKRFLLFLLRLNANKSATTSGIITFVGLVLVSIALHIIILDLIGISGVHNRFDLAKYHQTEIELIQPEPEPEPKKATVADAKLDQLKDSPAESWPISLRPPQLARISRISSVPTPERQLGVNEPVIPNSNQPISSGATNGKLNQGSTSTGTGSSPTGSINDGFGSTGSGLGGSSASTESGMGDDRTIGMCNTSMIGDGPVVFLFPYQTFFKPEWLPPGRFRDKLIEVWAEKSTRENINSLRKTFDELEDNGLTRTADVYVPLVALASYVPGDAGAEYKKKLVDLAESVYGRFSPQTYQSQVVVLEMGLPDDDTLSKMESLKSSLSFELDKRNLPTALIHRCFANIYIEANKPKEAEQEYEKCISILKSLPSDDTTAIELTLTQVSLGCLEIEYLNNFAKGKDVLDEARSLSKRDKHYTCLQAMCDLIAGDGQRKSGRTDEALRSYQKVLAVVPKNMGDSVWNRIYNVARLRMEDLQ